jgi:hypothetical protein
MSESALSVIARPKEPRRLSPADQRGPVDVAEAVGCPYGVRWRDTTRRNRTPRAFTSALADAVAAHRHFERRLEAVPA